MHIIAIIRAVLGVAALVLFRMQQAANAARAIADAADEARGLFRRWGWRRKQLKSPLDAVDDAREAAAAMTVAAAQSDGGITERRRLTPLIVRACGPTERSDLIEMLQAVAQADGHRDEVLAQDISRLAYNLRSS